MHWSRKFAIVSFGISAYIYKMFDDFRAYYHENVLAAFIEFRDRVQGGTAGESRDLRAAIAVCEALFHLREHLPWEHAISRSDVEAKCPDFGLVADIANVAKHRELTGNTPHGAPLISKADQLSEVLVITTYEDVEGEYRGFTKEVRASLNTGSNVNVMEVVTKVLNFWHQFLVDAGIESTPKTFVFDDCLGYRDRGACQTGPALHMIQGVRFSQTLQLRKFNPTSGKAEPVVLPPEARVNMRIWKPSGFEIELSLRHDQSGREYKRVISLTADEGNLIEGLPVDQREAHINALSVVRDAHREMITEKSRDDGEFIGSGGVGL